jgi:hypothetical protein
VWEEAKFARRFLDAIGSTVSDADIFRMVTVNAARCLGSRVLGRIEEGACADMFILESPIDSDSALEVFLSTGDDDVLATVVNGVPIYGRKTFLKQFGLPLQNLPRREGRAAADKAVHLPSTLTVDLGTAIDAVEDHLKSLSPPVFRSNLLASSDKPYQRRMQRLRAQAESFGWSAKQTAKLIAKGRPSLNGRVAVPPNAVRVWCGFKNGSSPRRFLEDLGSVFVPSTVMLMRELGLTAYFPAFPPADHPPACPDKVAIVCYETRKTYTDAARSVAGRMYALLHDSVFRYGKRGSWDAFPEPLAAPLRPRAAYHLFDGAIDWYSGSTRLCIGLRDAAQDRDAFYAQVHDVCQSLQQEAAAGASASAVDGALIAVDDEYFVFWDHRVETRAGDDAHLQRLAGFSQLVMNTQAADANANGQLFEAWSGFALQGGECLRLTFERRSFFPW